MTGLEQLMTQEEKAKLYAAIGYSETAVDPTLPKSVSHSWLYGIASSTNKNLQRWQEITFKLLEALSLYLNIVLIPFNEVTACQFSACLDAVLV